MVSDVLFNTEQVSLGLITHIPDAQVIDIGTMCPQSLGNLVVHWEELHNMFGSFWLGCKRDYGEIMANRSSKPLAQRWYPWIVYL